MINVNKTDTKFNTLIIINSKYQQVLLFVLETTTEMGNSNSGAGVNSGVDTFLLGVGVELELKFLIRYGVGVEF